MTHKLGCSGTVPLKVEVDSLLTRFTELGLVLWYESPELRNIVVLDPQWVITAVCTIIRDPIHGPALSPHSQRKFATFVKRMSTNGVLYEALLPQLLPNTHYLPEERKTLVTLMEKFGLLVRLFGDKAETNRRWLVPPLLEFCDADIDSPVKHGPHVFYVFFDTEEHLDPDQVSVRVHVHT